MSYENAFLLFVIDFIELFERIKYQKMKAWLKTAIFIGKIARHRLANREPF